MDAGSAGDRRKRPDRELYHPSARGGSNPKDQSNTGNEGNQRSDNGKHRNGGGTKSKKQFYGGQGYFLRFY